MQSLTQLLTVCLIFASTANAIQDSDEAALKALDQAYATAWKAGDSNAVMALFTKDATLVPHHGDDPIKGYDAIRQFWFNPEYAPTVVPQFDRESVEVIVSGDFGVVRGRSRLVWEYDGTRTTIPAGNYVIVATREGKGSDWRIRMLTWNDDPREWHVKRVD